MSEILTREELEHYRQNMRVASDAGDLWSDEYDAFSRVCDEVLALRAEVDHQRTEKEHAFRAVRETDDACRSACAAKDAEVERLRAEVENWRGEWEIACFNAKQQMGVAADEKARAEKAEQMQKLAEDFHNVAVQQRDREIARANAAEDRAEKAEARLTRLLALDGIGNLTVDEVQERIDAAEARAEKAERENEKLSEDFRDAHRAVTEWMEKNEKLAAALRSILTHAPDCDCTGTRIAARALADGEGK